MFNYRRNDLTVEHEIVTQQRGIVQKANGVRLEKAPLWNGGGGRNYLLTPWFDEE
jgi:hypothetical protein